MPLPVTIRPATPTDLDAIEAIETRVFDTDQLSRRSLRHFISATTVSLLVGSVGETVRGYALVGYRTSSALARLYSIAVSPEAGGGGLGRCLLGAAENAARDRGCRTMRLEVRADNAGAIRLYERTGYTRFGIYDDYYEDGQAAWRYEKPLGAGR